MVRVAWYSHIRGGTELFKNCAENDIALVHFGSIFEQVAKVLVHFGSKTMLKMVSIKNNNKYYIKNNIIKRNNSICASAIDMGVASMKGGEGECLLRCTRALLTMKGLYVAEWHFRQYHIL